MGQFYCDDSTQAITRARELRQNGRKATVGRDTLDDRWYVRVQEPRTRAMGA